jgi:DNA-binding response OmpR family regulator
MSKKILIVDDEDHIHKVLLRLLQSSAYEVVEAYNGRECLEMAKQHRPDLILLDINMPEMNGNETMKHLRHDKETTAIPVLMLTGNGELVDKIVGYELGVEDYITKPFDAVELKSRISALLD